MSRGKNSNLVLWSGQVDGRGYYSPIHSHPERIARTFLDRRRSTRGNEFPASIIDFLNRLSSTIRIGDNVGDALDSYAQDADAMCRVIKELNQSPGHPVTVCCSHPFSVGISDVFLSLVAWIALLLQSYSTEDLIEETIACFQHLYRRVVRVCGLQLW